MLFFRGLYNICQVRLLEAAPDSPRKKLARIRKWGDEQFRSSPKDRWWSCQLVQARAGGFLCYFLEMQGIVVLHITIWNSRCVWKIRILFRNCLICNEHDVKRSEHPFAFLFARVRSLSFRGIRFCRILGSNPRSKRLKILLRRIIFDSFTDSSRGSAAL